MCCFYKDNRDIFIGSNKSKIRRETDSVYQMGKTEWEFIAGRYRVAILQLQKNWNSSCWFSMFKGSNARNV